MSHVPRCVKQFGRQDNGVLPVRVVSRVRPLLLREIEKANSNSNDKSSYSQGVHVKQNVMEVHIPQKTRSTGHENKKVYSSLDFSFHQDESQQNVFIQSKLPELLESVVSFGYQATVFAYGQTGSGKTYTMSGIEEKIIQRGFNESPESDGIIPRSATYIFELLNSLRYNDHNNQYTYKVRASFLEIYNETVIDLLNYTKESLHLRQKQKPNLGFAVENLLLLDISDLDELIAVGAEGHKNRRVAGHQLNTDSSRSHSIFTVYIDKYEKDRIRYSGKVNFVDLAGSENLKQSQSKNVKETTSINRSLFMLGSVISSLSENKKSHTPYRDSALTKLLIDALIGESLTLMIACVSPLNKHIDETLRTLQYAIRAKNIELVPAVKTNHKEDKINLLNDEINRLKEVNQGLEKLLLYYGINIPDHLCNNQNNNQNNNGLTLSTSEELFHSQSPIQRHSHTSIGRYSNNNTFWELERENKALKTKIENLENIFLKRRNVNNNNNNNNMEFHRSSSSSVLVHNNMNNSPNLRVNYRKLASDALIHADKGSLKYNNNNNNNNNNSKYLKSSKSSGHLSGISYLHNSNNNNNTLRMLDEQISRIEGDINEGRKSYSYTVTDSNISTSSSSGYHKHRRSASNSRKSLHRSKTAEKVY